MVSSQVGDVKLAVPRDRNGSFTPQLVPKGSRRLSGLDEIIISLYAGGMTLRDIQHHLAAKPERAADSVSVVSAIELVKQTGQCDEAETETNQHEPPAVDGR